MKQDSTLQIIKDTVIQQNNDLVNIKSELLVLQAKNDSLCTILKNYDISENYFSDIIGTQMEWFAIVFGITFGLLGLIYWLGIFKYFSNKFKKTDSDINSVDNRINKNDQSLNAKIDKIDSSIREFYDEKHKSIDKEIIELNNKIEKSTSKTTDELKQLIKKQEVEFNSIKDELVRKILFTDFNSQRAMFFHAYDRKYFDLALSWGIPMLRIIVVDGLQENLVSWLNLVEECFDQNNKKENLKKNYDWLNDELISIKEKIDKEHLSKIDKMIKQLNQIYYSEVDGSED